jgi:hypothetical protein
MEPDGSLRCQILMRLFQLGILGTLLCLPLTASISQVTGAVLAVGSRQVPRPNLAKRIESADAIVVAKILSGTTLAAGSQVSSDIVLQINLVFKGDLIPGSAIAAHLTGRGYFVMPNARQSAIAEKLYGIWFLSLATRPFTVVSRDGNFGELNLAPVILPADAPAGRTGDTPASSVANALVAALQWMAATHGAQLNPQAEHTGTSEERRLASLSLNQFRNLTEDFQTLSPSTTFGRYRQFAIEQSVPLRAVGIQGLIAANDPEGVKHAAAEWNDLAAAADVSPIINSLMGYSNASDADAVRALGTLALREPMPEFLRQNVVYALRTIHTKEALPTLVALLDNKEERIRPYALSGLCLFVRNAPTVTAESVPSMAWLQSRKPTPLLNPETESHCLVGGAPNGATDVDAYARFWKSWWSEHRLEFEKP